MTKLYKKSRTLAAGFLVMLQIVGGFFVPLSFVKAALGGVSPTNDQANGFPLWYEDSNGLRLELGKNPADPLLVASPVIAGNTFSETTGFGGEAFYWFGRSVIALNTGGKAELGLALEASYVSGEPINGDQMVFSRIRVQVDAPVAGTYTVFHPYGTKTYNVTTPGARSINDTIDVGLVPIKNAPNAFQIALGGDIGPFLTAVDPLPPAGYIGDPAVDTMVTGSPINQNFFRVEGPAGSAIGGAGIDALQNDTFRLSGKISTVVDAPSVTVNAQQTTDTTPQISGTVSDPTATVSIDINGAVYAAVVNGNIWTADVITPLAPGTFNVIATATTAGGTMTDTSADELTVFVSPYVGLAAVSPAVNPVNGFPLWYQDTNGLTLELGKDPADPLLIPDPVIAGNAFSEQTGFGAEAFYWSGSTRIPIANGGFAELVMGLEGTYATGAPANGDQMVFSRMRIRIDAPVTGDYTVTTPYGTKTYTATTTGVDAIRETIDIGAIPISQLPTAFQIALGGEIGPFLTAVNPAPPAGYLGNPAIEQTVTGSPTGNNFFRVDGPAGSDIDGAGNAFVQKDTFNISGKIYVAATPVTVTVDPITTDVQTPTITGTVSDPNATVVATVNGVAYNAVVTPGIPNNTWSTTITTPLVNGTYDVTATATNLDGIFTDATLNELTVSVPQVLTTITVSPVNPSILAGVQQQMSAATLDQFGQPMTATVDWTSSDPLVGTIDVNGLFTALAAGTTTITASNGLISGTSVITVTQPPPDLEAPTLPTGVTATPFNTSEIDLAWTAATDNVGVTGYDIFRDGVLLTTVTGTTYSDTGLISNTPYAYTVEAFDAAGNRSGQTLPVNATTPAQVATQITIDPLTASVNIGFTQQFTISILDQDGNPMITAITWTTSDPAIGTIDLNGLFTAVAAGPVTVTASTDLISASANVTVVDPNAPVLTTINVTPVNPIATVGDAITLSAETLDQFGAPIAATVSWTSSDTAVGSIDPATGAFSALSAGMTTITATSGAVTGTSLVTVNAAPDTIAPTVPADVTATPISTTQIDLAWTAATDNVGVTGYDIFRDGVLLTTVTGTTYSDTGLIPNTPYAYTVEAFDAAGNRSGQTLPVNATTLDLPILPVVTETIPIPDLTNNDKPDYTFTSSVAGTINFSGFTSLDTTAVAGDNKIQFESLQNGTYTNLSLTVTDTYGNTSMPLAISPFTIDVAHIELTINPVSMPDTSAPLTGAIIDQTATIEIEIKNSAKNLVFSGPATNNGDGTWTLPAGSITANLPDGLYDIELLATKTDGATIETVTRGALTIDSTIPHLTSIDISPKAATLNIGEPLTFVAQPLDQYNQPITATVQWSTSNPSLATINALTGELTTISAGTIMITATSGGISGSTYVIIRDADDEDKPNVTITAMVTTDRSPALGGTVKNTTATIAISVGGATYTANNNGDGTWSLPAGTITPKLKPGTYDVAALATDAKGRTETDASTGELIIQDDGTDEPSVNPPANPPLNPQDETSTDGSKTIKGVTIFKPAKKGATITWSTPTPSETKIVFSTNRKYVSGSYLKKKKKFKTTRQNNSTTNHQVDFRTLKKNKKYYFRTVTVNPDGSETYSEIMQFKTAK